MLGAKKITNEVIMSHNLFNSLAQITVINSFSSRDESRTHGSHCYRSSTGTPQLCSFAGRFMTSSFKEGNAFDLSAVVCNAWAPALWVMRTMKTYGKKGEILFFGNFCFPDKRASKKKIIANDDAKNIPPGIDL